MRMVGLIMMAVAAVMAPAMYYIITTLGDSLGNLWQIIGVWGAVFLVGLLLSVISKPTKKTSERDKD